MNKNLKVVQNVSTHDASKDLYEIHVSLNAYIDGDGVFAVLPQQSLDLTRKGAIRLLKQLSIAIELSGQDYLLYDNGTISVDSKRYASIEDYRNGIEIVED
jgi:hypothetical protein